MKTKKFVFGVLIAVLIIVVAGAIIYVSQYKAKTITSFFDNDTNKIDKIDIVDGSNGNVITIDDKKVISDISGYLSKLKLTKVHNDSSTGWNYRFSVYESNTEKLNITFIGEGLCTIGDTKYKIEKSTDVTAKSLFDEAKRPTK